MYLEFNPLRDRTGLELLDLIETRRFTLLTDSPVKPTSAGTDGFAFPVDSACDIRVDRFRLPHTVPVDVRSVDGTHLAAISPPESQEFPDDEYLLDVHGPMKIYIRVDSGFHVEADTETVRVDFGAETPIRVGARSYHSAPAGTVTVPDDPEEVMKAVSTFSSALKTTSPERSWPTLRGHPPRIEPGEELEIPDSLDVPDTGVTIRVPSEYGPIYAVAPLAFYLGAEIRPGETARLETDTGVSRKLGDGATEIGDSAGQILKHVFMLDCVTRTEGYYPVELHERTVLEGNGDVNLDFASLYEASIPERLATYLSAPDDAIEAITPRWHHVTHVEPEFETVELLPYVVNDLSLVRVETPSNIEWSETQEKTTDALSSFKRRAAAAGDFVRSAGTSSGRLAGTRSPDEHANNRDGADDRDDADELAGIPDLDEYVELPEVDAFQQSWVGEGTPVYGAKLLREAFAHETPEPTDGVIEITVVCNDEAMREEWNAVAEIYGRRDDLRVDVTREFSVSTDELRDLLAADTGLFHFIGHIDGHGFQCPDGVLDAEELEEANATTVLLNGCRSYHQGIRLVEAGANATIVSLWDVGNRGAVEVGETLARLFDHGFDVGTAVTIVEKYAEIGREYVVLGDPGVVLAQNKKSMPRMYHVSVSNESEIETKLIVELYAYPTEVHSVGTIIDSYLDDIDLEHVAIGRCETMITNRNKLQQSLSESSVPLIVEGTLTWSDLWFNVY